MNLENMFGDFSFDIATVMKMNDITPVIQKHLSHVYFSLAICMLSAAVGVYLSGVYRLNGGYLSAGACFLSLYWLHNERDKLNVMKRTFQLCVFGFFKGISIANIVYMSYMVDPLIVGLAFVGTVAVFACFSMAALIAKRRSYLYLGGMLSSALSLLFVLSLSNIFMQSHKVYAIQLYGGLLVFAGYVIVDTQMIIERAQAGSRDFAGHAVQLFINFVAIFVRLVMILVRNRDGRGRDDSRRDDRRKPRRA